MGNRSHRCRRHGDSTQRERHWLYAANDLETNDYLHVRLFQARTAERTILFLRELKEKVPVTQATVLVDDAAHLKGSFCRLDLRIQCVVTEIGMLSNV